MSTRTPLDADQLRAALGPRWPTVTVVSQTTSTNADLLASATAADRSVLVAELQLAGRGRLDRTWTSPPGAGLTFSVLLRPTVPVMHWGWLPLLAGVALHEAVSSATGVTVTLKWPNDLLAGDATQADRKLAGILAQTGGVGVVVGIGLNVSTTADELPVESATSLALCGAGDIDRGALLTAILTGLDAWYSQWTDVGGDADACGLSAAYVEACSTIGQLVAVTTGDAVVRGQAVGIDATARMIIDVDGTCQSIGAGDVEHVRPG